MKFMMTVLGAASAVIGGAANAQDDHAIVDFSNRLCSSLEMNYGYEDAYVKAEDVFLRFSELSRQSEREIIASRLQALWAENGDAIICENASLVKPHIRTPQAFLKRVVDMNMEGQIFNGWLLDSDYPIDVNAVQWVDGEPETLLDYLDLIIADESRHEHYSMNEIMRLRHHLITNFGAMTAEELEL